MRRVQGSGRRHRWISGLASVLLTASALAAGSNRPLELSAASGGSGPRHNEVRLDPTGLTCTYPGYDPETSSQHAVTVHVDPGEKQWKRLRADLDRLNVWSWEAKYVDPRVMDGVQWSLTVRYADRAIASRGSNRYPGRDGKPVDGTVPSPAYKDVIGAITRLLPDCFI